MRRSLLHHHQRGDDWRGGVGGKEGKHSSM